QAPEVRDLLPDRHPRVQPTLFRHVAESQPLLEPHRPPVPRHLARVELDEAEDRAHGRRLARPVRPEVPEHPASAHAERAAVERPAGVESLARSGDRQHALDSCALTETTPGTRPTSTGSSSASGAVSTRPRRLTLPFLTDTTTVAGSVQRMRRSTPSRISYAI